PHHGNQIVGAREAADVRGEKSAVGRHWCPSFGSEEWKQARCPARDYSIDTVFWTGSAVGNRARIRATLAMCSGDRLIYALRSERAIRPRPPNSRPSMTMVLKSVVGRK